MPGIEAVEFPVPGDDAHVPEAVVIRVHGHHGLGLPGKLGGKVLVAGIEAVIRKLPAELGGVGHLHLGEGAAHAVHVLLPEQDQDAVVQIVLDVPAVDAAIEVHGGIEGHLFVRAQQAPVPGVLNDLQELLRLVHADDAVAALIRRRAGIGILRDGVVHRFGCGFGGRRRRGFRRRHRGRFGRGRLCGRGARGHRGLCRGRSLGRCRGMDGKIGKCLPSHHPEDRQGEQKAQEGKDSFHHPAKAALPLLFLLLTHRLSSPVPDFSLSWCKMA